MADNNEIIGGVGVNISGDFSDLAGDFEAAVALAVSQGQTLAEAIQSAMATPDVTPVTDALESIAPAVSAAAEQLNLFGAAADNIPWADAAGQLNLFTTELEPFTAGMEGAQAATDAFVPSLSGVVEQADAATVSSTSLLTTLLEFAGIELTFEALKDALVDAAEAFVTLQNATISLTALTGSASAATASIGRLKDLAISDAMTFPTLVAAQQRMTAFGFSAKDSTGLLEGAANAAAATGNNLQQMTNALDRIAISGTVMARTLATLGISIDDLGRAMGVTAGEAKKAFAALDEGARIEVLTEALQKYQGVAEEVAQGLGGQWQNLKTQVLFVLQDIGGAIAPMATAVIHGFAEMAAGVDAFLQSLRVTATGFDAMKSSFDAWLAKEIAIVTTTAGVQKALKFVSETLDAGVISAGEAAHATRALEEAQNSITKKDFAATIGAQGKAVADSIAAYAGAAAGASKLHEAQATLNQAVAVAKATLDAVTASYREQKPLMDGQVATLDDMKRAHDAVTQAANAAHGALEKVAAVKFHPIKFADLSPANAVMVEELNLGIAKQHELEKAIAKTQMAEVAFANSLGLTVPQLREFNAAFNVDSLVNALPPLTNEMAKMANTAKMLGPDGQTAKLSLDGMNVAAREGLAPLKAYYEALHKLSEKDGDELLKQYAIDVQAIQHPLDQVGRSAEETGRLMNAAWLKAHPDITKADEDIQRITQHMADLQTAQQKGIISSAQMSQDMVKDLEKLSPAVKQVNQEMTQMFNSINSEIATDIVHWKGLHSSITSIFQSLGTGIIKIMLTAVFGPIEHAITQMVTKWVASHVTMTATALHSSATEATAASTAAAEAAAAVKLSAAAQVQAYAGVAFAAAFAAEAAIPIVGPALAPAAGAAAYAEVMAGGMAGFAEGGTVGGALGSPQMILAHGGEQVISLDQLSGRVALPSIGGSSSTFSSSSSTSTVNNSGGDIHFHGNFSGVTKDAVQQVMNSAVKQARRVNARL